MKRYWAFRKVGIYEMNVNEDPNLRREILHFFSSTLINT